jgi:hypothetical protein
LSAFGPAGGNQTEAADTFYTAIYQRLVGIMVVLATAGTAAVWIKYRAVMALSFLAGSFIAILNFHWLRRTIEAMGPGLEDSGKPPSRSGVVARFLLRYVLIAAAAYVILKSTANNLYGLFAGLSLPVGAILIEALYEIYRARRTEL